MSLILNIETATTVCSVSVSRNEDLLATEELDAGYTHAENLHVFIQKALVSSDLQIGELDAIAVSRGPGSYTGLRIGTSTAKGLAYALKIPLLAVDTLQIMSHMACKRQGEKALYCPMIDARRMEVYTALYDENLNMIKPPEAFIADDQSVKIYEGKKTFFFGDGMQKCRTLLEQIGGAGFIDDIKPSAAFMPLLSYKKLLNSQTEDPAYYEPYYLKDFIAGSKKAPGSSV